MSFSRRKFILSSVISSIGIVVLSSPLKHPLNYLINNFNADLKALLIQAKQARVEENYILSENLYNQIINQWPNERAAYFGLRKTFLSQKHKEYNVVKLFEQSIQTNPEDVVLICQLAKEYTSIALGNKEVESMLGYSTPLLEKAKSLYLLALSIDSQTPTPLARGEDSQEDHESNTQAETGLDKVENKIEQEADIIDARDSAIMKSVRKSNQFKFKNRFDKLSETQLKTKLNTLKAKPNPQTRAKHIKELYRLNININKKSNNYAEACALAYQLHLFDPKDTTCLGIYKRLALKEKQYNQLVTVLKNNDILQSTFWSKLAYFDGIHKLYKNNPSSRSLINDLSTQINLMESNFSLTRQMKIELSFRKFELSLITSNINTLKSDLLNIGNLLYGFDNPHNAIRFCRSFSRFFIVAQQREIAIKFIDFYLNQENIIDDSFTNDDQLYKIIFEYALILKIENKDHIDQLFKLRENLYSNSTV